MLFLTTQLAIGAYALIASAAPLWPLPLHYSLGNQVVWMSRDVQFHYSVLNSVSVLQPNRNDFDIPTLLMFLPKTSFPAYSNHSQDLHSTSLVVEAAIHRAQQRIFTDQLVPWKFHPRNSDFEPDTDASKAYITSVKIQQNATDPTDVYKALAGAVDESYTLTISANGNVVLTAVSSIGILRALETFTQLFYQHSQTPSVYTPFVPVIVSDAPKFSHRGLNLDVARNYYAPSDIKRTIDALSWNKMNRLHLHITDGQSWPLDIPSLPGLSEKGAYMAGLSYSPAILADIQEYGANRGVQVILEIDQPGHTSSIALSYPELIAAFNVQPDWYTYAAEPPSGSLKLNSSAVYDFLETLWDDLLPRVYPYSAYFHTGGDEVKANAYLLDETVRSNDSSILQPLVQRLVDFNHDKVRAAGLTPIVWEEMLLEWNLTLGSDVIVQTWQSDDAVLQTVQKGHKALVGNYNYWVSRPYHLSTSP